MTHSSNNKIMSQKKTRVFQTTGFTVPLADGVSRPFTIVGLLSEDTREETISDIKVSQSKRKLTKTITYEEVDVYTQTLTVGIAVVSPADKDVATNEVGVTIATGKAQKTPSLVLTASRPYFTKAVVESILEREAEIFTKNAGKVIKVSAPKKGE